MSTFYTYVYSIYVPGKYVFYIGSRTKYGIADPKQDSYFGSPSNPTVKQMLWEQGDKSIVKVFEYEEGDNHSYETARYHALRLERFIQQRRDVLGKASRIFLNKAIALDDDILGPKFGEKNHRFKGVIKAHNQQTGEIKILHGKQSILDAGFDDSTVYKCISGKRRQHSGFTFQRLL